MAFPSVTSASIAPLAARERERLPDALRGFALFGILIVNIMSFSSGLSGSSLGGFTAKTTAADWLTVALVAFLAEFKFYPIFSFLFGYGFTLFWIKAKRKGADVSALFDRRITFMAVLGVAHGVFIWFGDILSRYAIVALFLKGRLDYGPKRLLKSMRNWLIVSVVVSASLSLVMLIGTLAVSVLDVTSQEPTLTREAVEKVRELYAGQGYWDVTQQRAADYVYITVLFMFLVPQVLLLFLTGAFVARAGWLRHPAQHREKWSRILQWSLAIGVPVNLAWAALQLGNSYDQSIWFAPIAAILDVAMPVMAASYIACFALLSADGKADALLDFLAHTGRMPLTNYITQSVICSFVLYGYGLGLGDDLGQAKLALMAVAIYALQTLWSRAWLSRYEQGPLEAVWRRFTYSAPDNKKGEAA